METFGPALNLDSRPSGRTSFAVESGAMAGIPCSRGQWLSGRLSLSGTWSEPVLRRLLWPRPGAPCGDRGPPPVTAGSRRWGTIKRQLAGSNGLSVNQTTVLRTARASPG